MATQNIQLSLPPYNSANWNSPLNGNFTVLDAVFGNTKAISVTGADYALTTTDCQNMRINITGNNGGSNITINFPKNIGGSWIVTNNAASSGGTVNLAVTGSVIPPINIPSTGSVFVFSDGANLYSSTSGAQGNFLPLTGGTITGDLAVNGKFSTGGTPNFVNGITAGSLTTVKDLKITGAFDLSTTNLAVASLSAGGGPISGTDKLSVGGSATINGDTVVNGNLKIPLGNITVGSPTGANSLSGATSIPSGSSFTIKAGSNFTVENGANLSLSGTFAPTAVSTGDLTSSTKISVTGSGGINAGPGALQAAGALTIGGAASIQGAITGGSTIAAKGDINTTGGLSVSGTANFLSASNHQGVATFSAAINASARMTIPDILIKNPGGYGTLYLQPSDTGILGEVSVQNSNNNVYIGFYNGLALNVAAYLDMRSGRFTASGGLGVSVSSLPAGSPTAVLPGISYEGQNGDACIDVGLAIEYLVNKINHLTSEIAALKAGTSC